jgi:hypothetical protein
MLVTDLHYKLYWSHYKLCWPPITNFTDPITKLTDACYWPPLQTLLIPLQNLLMLVTDLNYRPYWTHPLQTLLTPTTTNFTDPITKLTDACYWPNYKLYWPHYKLTFTDLHYKLYWSHYKLYWCLLQTSLPNSTDPISDFTDACKLYWPHCKLPGACYWPHHKLYWPPHYRLMGWTSFPTLLSRASLTPLQIDLLPGFADPIYKLVDACHWSPLQACWWLLLTWLQAYWWLSLTSWQNFTLQTLPDPLQNLLLMLVTDLITIFTDRIYSLP